MTPTACNGWCAREIEKTTTHDHFVRIGFQKTILTETYHGRLVVVLDGGLLKFGGKARPGVVALRVDLLDLGLERERLEDLPALAGVSLRERSAGICPTQAARPLDSYDVVASPDHVVASPPPVLRPTSHMLPLSTFEYGMFAIWYQP